VTVFSTGLRRRSFLQIIWTKNQSSSIDGDR